MEQLLKSLRASFPALRFTPGKTFVWSPETKEVFYKSTPSNPNTHNHDTWSLLHETGHALLEHTNYQADVQLLQLEAAAWSKAKELAQRFDITIDENHIQDCLDTYRDWLHARAVCPTCTTRCLQQSDYTHYRCHNCHTTWKVTPSRFCRAYRAVKNVPRPTLVFHATEGI